MIRLVSLKGLAKRLLSSKENGAKAVAFIQQGLKTPKGQEPPVFFDDDGKMYVIQRTKRERIVNNIKNLPTTLVLIWVFFAGTFWFVYLLCMAVRFIVDNLLSVV